MNKVILMGRLARDPDLRTTPSGRQRALMTIAVDRRISRANVQPGQQTADFISLTAWERTAEFADKYLKKGSQILVEGRIQTGSYERDGQKVYTTDVIVERIEFAGSRSQGNQDGDFSPHYSAPAAAPPLSSAPTPPPFDNPPISDEDIPF
ncbi:MAG: single-stranded DNA-binding protein [Schwartzia sp.]|nr:single-stranded DNA-binding protein [Schwartzia sp. (in: firmicutes)]